ncbi:MAG: hypothetical protein ACKO85_20755, partial [Isosphaeraceae bacterium]
NWQNPPMTISLELWHSQRDLNRPFCLFVGSHHPPNVEAVKQIQAWLMAEPDHQQFQFFRKPLSFVRLVVLISDRLPSPNSFYAYC